MRARARLCVCVCVLARQSSTESRKIAVGDGRASWGWFLAYKERLGTQGPRPGRQKTYELRRTMALEMPLAVLKRRTPGGWCLPVLLRKTGKKRKKCEGEGNRILVRIRAGFLLFQRHLAMAGIGILVGSSGNGG